VSPRYPMRLWAMGAPHSPLLHTAFFVSPAPVAVKRLKAEVIFHPSYGPNDPQQSFNLRAWTIWRPEPACGAGSAIFSIEPRHVCPLST